MKRILSVLLALVLLAALCPTAYAQTEAPSFAVVDITEMDIPALQQAVDDGYLTYEQIMVLYLERIEAYADMYHCLISVSKTALEEARECDRIYRESGRTSLLFGLPAIIKDNINVAGMATTNGHRYLAGNIARTDAPVVAGLKKAGAIIVAKANMDTDANHAQYSISDYGRVNNAFDLNRTSYGSSGGSAVAAAASLAPICVGTDTNASVRVPSSGNGVVGIRPTKGLLSATGISPLMVTHDTAGCMAKSVSDTALILSAMDNFEKDYTATLSTEALSGLRIGVVTNLVGRCSSEIREIFNNALSVLEEQGATIVRVSLPLGSINNVVSAYRSTFVAALNRNDLDLVVYPTVCGGVLTHSAAVAGSNSNGYFISPSGGVPGVTVPMGTDKNGMPSGLEFVGRPYDDALALAAAYDFEQALGLTVRTTLAPSLYDGAPESIHELFALRSTSPYQPIIGFEENYESVAGAYEEAVGYLSTAYYSDADAEQQARTLLDNYASAVIDYEKGCQSQQLIIDALAQRVADMARRQQQLVLLTAIAGAVVLVMIPRLLLTRRRSAR